MSCCTVPGLYAVQSLDCMLYSPWTVCCTVPGRYSRYIVYLYLAVVSAKMRDNDRRQRTGQSCRQGATKDGNKTRDKTWSLTLKRNSTPNKRPCDFDLVSKGFSHVRMLNFVNHCSSFQIARNYTHTHSARLPYTTDRPVAETSTCTAHNRTQRA
jgi:hypothetical protein